MTSLAGLSSPMPLPSINFWSIDPLMFLVLGFVPSQPKLCVASADTVSSLNSHDFEVDMVIAAYLTTLMDLTEPNLQV
jgi:hypothetical protein